ncbi:MAG: phosphate-starvation-inducible PsiE family protein [Vulcanococcus sp.]
MGLLNDRGFLAAITGFERALAKVLSIALSLVLVVASVQMLLFLGNDLLDLQVNWTGEGLIRLLDEILVILIALEVLQNLTAYLREHVVQIELVLVTALTAVARKVIVMPPGMQKSPGELIGLGVAVLALAAAYWLVRQSNVRARPTRTEPAIGSPGPDRLPPAGGVGGG